MAQNDAAVLTAAVGYVFIAPPGTASPTPAEIKSLDPALAGEGEQQLVIPTAATGTYTLTVDGEESAPLTADTDSAQDIQDALTALAGVGSGGVTVTQKTPAVGANDTFVFTWPNERKDITVDGTSLTGGSAVVRIHREGLPAGWEPLGHTSRNDMPEFGFEGGDSEVKGTWQNAKLREVVTNAAADYLTLFLHQFDTTNFELYYGKNASSVAGVFGVSGDVSKVNEYAFLIIIIDGDQKVGFYSPKASVKRDDAIGLPVDDFASLPVKATFLKHGNANIFEWINEDLFV
jgi:hypothetical protein